MLPTIAWGTQFPLVSFVNVSNQHYQLIANSHGTVANIDSYQYKLNAGEQIVITVSGSAMLKSNLPIHMIQIGKVSQYDNLLRLIIITIFCIVLVS